MLKLARVFGALVFVLALLGVLMIFSWAQDERIGSIIPAFTEREIQIFLVNVLVNFAVAVGFFKLKQWAIYLFGLQGIVNALLYFVSVLSGREKFGLEVMPIFAFYLVFFLLFFSARKKFSK
jgi:hypothetical protein